MHVFIDETAFRNAARSAASRDTSLSFGMNSRVGHASGGKGTLICSGEEFESSTYTGWKESAPFELSDRRSCTLATPAIWMPCIQSVRTGKLVFIRHSWGQEACRLSPILF